MGLIRKAASMSTLGGVKYTSKREAQTKAAHAQARAADAEADLLREQAKTERKNRRDANAAERQERADATPDLPWWKQPTLGRAITKAAKDRRANRDVE